LLTGDWIYHLATITVIPKAEGSRWRKHELKEVWKGTKPDHELEIAFPVNHPHQPLDAGGSIEYFFERTRDNGKTWHLCPDPRVVVELAIAR